MSYVKSHKTDLTNKDVGK